jgi:hypothetical protein
MSDKPTILTGPPAGTKPSGGRRVDFRIEQLDNFIATKGTAYWWSRGARCPCRGNVQTKQADPNCTLCKGTGWLYFLPEADLLGAETDRAGNEVELNDSQNAVSIPVVITNLTKDPQVYERFGQFIFGTGRATCQSWNRFGYRDRFVARDATLSYSQLIEASGQTEILLTGIRSPYGLWTAISKINLLRSATVTYKEHEDFKISDEGTIVWLKTSTMPARGVLLTVQGEFHPTWIVMDHVYAARDTLVSKKQQTSGLRDQFRNLPLHAMVKLDFLVDPDD